MSSADFAATLALAAMAIDGAAIMMMAHLRGAMAFDVLAMPPANAYGTVPVNKYRREIELRLWRSASGHDG